MTYYLQDLKNSIDFFLRQNLTFSRKNYFEKNETKENLFESSEIITQEALLLSKYNLNFVKSNTTRQNYLENLYTVDLFDKYLEINFEDKLKVLDVGCKNWFYAKGEYFFFKKYCNSLDLDGIELDANRLYTNFYSRKEVAQFHIKGLINTKYIAGNFLQDNNKYNYIIWILPFVFKEPLLKWGLPLNCFAPEKMLSHAYNSLIEGGKIFIINQGLDEYNAQKILCEKLEINYDELGKIESSFLKYKDRYALIIKH